MARAVREFRAAAKRHHVKHAVLLRHLVFLYRQRGFRPLEAYRCGVSDPALSLERLEAAISKRALIRLQRRLNPAQLEPLTEDKSLFYPYCQGLGLPVPELHAILDRPAGVTASGEPLASRGDWLRLVHERLPAEFVVKPAEGVYGWGVRVYRRCGDALEDAASGEPVDPAALYDDLQSDPSFRRFVVQQRLRGHPELVELSGTQALQTLRLTTWIDPRGECQVCAPLFKVVCSDRLTDNSDWGRSGNLSATVDPRQGRLGPALSFASRDEFDTHPRTGARITGFQLPHWERACELVRRAARLFLPIRTLGWDVALTAEGPVIVEANMWWDPVNDVVSFPSGAGYAREMRALLPQLEAEASRLPHAPTQARRAATQLR